MQRRVLWLLELDWREASEADVVAMVGWLRVAGNPQRRRRRADSAVPGTVNLRTGKPHPGPGYAPRTINHALSVISGFYAYHRHHGRGPTTNPVPDSASRRAALAHRNPLAPPPTFRRGRLRQKVDQPLPRAIPDGMWDELFTAMTCDRDRALLLFYVSSGARAGELLAVRLEDVDWSGQRIYVVSKGTRARQPIPASPQAFLLLAAYLDEAGLPEPGTPLWRTRRGESRPLSYWAMRRILQRANGRLGTNWTLHDLRHTAKRRRGVRLLLEHLERFPGDTWQERWQASGLNAEDAGPVRLLGRPGSRFDGHDLTAGLTMVFAMRVIQPSVGAFQANTFTRYPGAFARVQSDPQLDAYFAALDARADLRRVHRHLAKFDVACALTTQGINLCDLTPAALLHYSLECRRLGATVGSGRNATTFAAVTAWSTPYEHGHFPPQTPPTLRTFIYRGQKTIEQLVDFYQVQHPGVRQLLIDYLTRRRAENDYATIEGLARHLAGHFWATIERLNPGQRDLVIARPLYDQWRTAIQFRGNDPAVGQHRRRDPESILLAVRGLYVDLHSWAVEEPDRWGRWVAPCPVRPAELRGFGRRRRAINDGPPPRCCGTAASGSRNCAS